MCIQYSFNVLQYIHYSHTPILEMLSHLKMIWRSQISFSIRTNKCSEKKPCKANTGFDQLKILKISVNLWSCKYSFGLSSDQWNDDFSSSEWVSSYVSSNHLLQFISIIFMVLDTSGQEVANRVGHGFSQLLTL